MKSDFPTLIRELLQHDLDHLLADLVSMSPESPFLFADLFTPIILERCRFFGLESPHAEMWTEYCVLEILALIPDRHIEIEPSKFHVWVLAESWRILSGNDKRRLLTVRLARAMMRIRHEVEQALQDLQPLHRRILELEGQRRVWNDGDMAKRLSISETELQRSRFQARSGLLALLSGKSDLLNILERLKPAANLLENLSRGENISGAHGAE